MFEIKVIICSEKDHYEKKIGNKIKIKALRIMQVIALDERKFRIVGKCEVISGRDVMKDKNKKEDARESKWSASCR